MSTEQISGIIIAALFNFLGILIITAINISSNKRHNSKQALKELFDEKVNRSECNPAMQRMGRQIDKLEEADIDHSKCIHGLERGMAFVVGKMNGNYDAIKNTGLNLG